MKGFTFTASRISRYFHTRGARSNEDVARVWSKYISPTLDPDTDIASTIFGDSDELDSQSSADQSLSSPFQSPMQPSLNQTAPSQTTPCVTPSSNSRYVAFLSSSQLWHNMFQAQRLFNYHCPMWHSIIMHIYSIQCLGISIPVHDLILVTEYVHA